MIQIGLDGRLSPAERARLDAHIADCASCRATWDEYRRLGQTATDWARLSVSTPDTGDAFTTQVMARIAADQSSQRPHSSWQTILCTASAVLILSALSFWIGPLLPHVLLSVALTGLPSPREILSFESLWRTFSHVPQDAQSAWDLMTTDLVPQFRWVWSALALTLGVNAVFAWRVRRQPRGADAR